MPEAVKCPACKRDATLAFREGRSTWWACPNPECERGPWATAPPLEAACTFGHGWCPRHGGGCSYNLRPVKQREA